jgi:group I intron endonuclease
MSEKKFVLYKHTCPNGKVYIGITCKKPQIRWNYGKGYQKNKHFYNAILKYGWDNIKHEILFDNVSEKDIYSLEQETIAQYKATNRKYGYNKSIGGERAGLGVKLSKERKKRISEMTKGENNPFYHKKHKPEVVEFLKRLNVGRKHTKKELKKMIDNSPLKKKVYQYDTELNLINTYCGKREAIRQTGIDMGQALIGKKHTAGGYIWSYEEIPRTEQQAIVDEIMKGY